MRGSQGAGQVTMQVTTLSGTGRGYRDGQLEQAMFAVPTGCACDAEGNVYIADRPDEPSHSQGGAGHLLLAVS